MKKKALSMQKLSSQLSIRGEHFSFTKVTSPLGSGA